MGRLGVLLGLVAAAVGVLGWRFLRVVRTPDDGSREPISVDGARAWTESVVAAPAHDCLAVRFAPSTLASLELLPEGSRFYPRIVDDIAAAQHSVHVIQYGFKPGFVADRFLPVLVERAAAGVQVRMVLDAVGSGVAGVSRSMLDGLAAAGVQIAIHDAVPPRRYGTVGERRVRWTRDGLGRVDHRKLYVIDGRIGWMGGAGIEDHFEDGRFHDLFVRVTGSTVSQLQAAFLASFAELGGPLPDDLAPFFPAPEDPGTIDTTFLMNWPPGWLPVTEAAEQLIDGARERLDIMNPYVGDRGMVDRIVAAAQRGVAVRIVVPDAVHGNAVAYAAFQHHYDRLLAAGVAIWEYPALVHAKALVADDELLVGTLNLDAWALYRNPEIALHLRDAAVAETFRRELFEVDIAASQAGSAAVGRRARLRNAALERMAPLL
ncbi:MAG TPA: phosphatidylserine/phosphatidylglycerophosphate/cardiolipin synthase family protein [Candidatus Limnocylindria bacterium]|nr:phosphatidylserine/phosphatidylglycerophosphate/cardiolipin synthase family protein [Candidatus Limnocylindria bacterium]